MAAEVNKRFLDYAGLETLWGVIKGRFADKDKTITKLEFSLSEDKNTQTLIATLADETTKIPVALPNASRTQAGLMSPGQFAIVDDLEHNIEDMAPFAGLKLGNGDSANEVSLLGRKANIELKYMSEPDQNGNTNKAYIALVDPNYPAGGSWTESDKAAYDAAADKTNWHSWRQSNGTHKYYYWSEAGKIGPINALGEPIMAQAVSKIDVTELVKTGLLSDSDVVINPEGQVAGTYLKLTFNAYNAADGSSKPQIQYINVTDLVEVYTAGEGISITDEAGAGANDDKHTGVINVVAATDAKLGAFKTGYTEGNKTYAVKLDADKKAYVAVPWNETVVQAGSPEVDKDDDGNPYLVVGCTPNSVKNDDDGSTTTTYTVSVAAGEGIKQAESLARTAVQKVTGDANYININADDAEGKPVNLAGKGTQWSVTLDQTVKDSLALADTAVQSISVANFADSDRPQGAAGTNDIVITPGANNANKGEKTYTISLGERTKASLNLADTAMQDVTIFGTKLDETDAVYSAAEAKKAMALGSASEVNISEDGTLATAESTLTYVAETNVAVDLTKSVKNVPTVAAVKTYVDNSADATKTAYETLVSNTVASLDSSASAGVTVAADTAQNVEANRIFTKVVIKDGKIVAPGATGDDADPTYGASEARALKITDIVDFRELSTAEITALCI